MAIHPTNPNILIAAYSNYGAPSIFLTNNANAATPVWVNVSRNIEALSVRSVSIVEAGGSTLYVAGTSRGLYTSTDPTTTDWVRVGTTTIGMALVSQLWYRPADQKLLVGTHGNGMFMVDVLPPVLPVELLAFNGELVKTAIAGSKVQIVLDRTPFYAESGGQVGDTGYLAIGEAISKVNDVQKQADLFIHIGQVERGKIAVGDNVNAQVAVSERRRIQAHHTATHLLQAALKKIVDSNVSQAGSLVDSDRLRFDFNLNRAVTTEELKQIELQINNWIAEAHESVIEVLPISQAKAKGAIAMFGEKYGAEVRVMDIPNVSMELCGGTHVKNTSEIGLFKIISEAGVASGVRRIEAIAGQAVLEYLTLRDNIAKDLSDRFKIKPEEISDRITGLQHELKNAQKEVEHLKQQLALVKADSLIHEAEAVGEFKILVAQLPDIEAEALKSAAEKLSAKLGHSAVVLGSFTDDGKVTLVASFSKEVIAKGLQAGKFIGAIAKICGGGGGGRPNLAQAGGKDASKLPEALEAAETQLRHALGNP
jgi:alanyl-tRNA synthetase